jgi:hypothetical protein
MTGKATLTTVPSMNARLDPRMVVTRTHRPEVAWLSGVTIAPRITPSSLGGFPLSTRHL